MVRETFTVLRKDGSGQHMSEQARRKLDREVGMVSGRANGGCSEEKRKKREMMRRWKARNQVQTKPPDELHGTPRVEVPI